MIMKRNQQFCTQALTQSKTVWVMGNFPDATILDCVIQGDGTQESRKEEDIVKGGHC